MRNCLIILLFILLPALSNAQLSIVDSLKNDLKNAPDGALRFKANNDVYYYYQEINRDSALYYAEQGLFIAQRNHHKLAEGVALVQKSYQLIGLGRYADALQYLHQAFSIAKEVKNDKEENWDLFITKFDGNDRLLLLSYTHHIYGVLMRDTENVEQQIIHFKEGGRIGREIDYAPRFQLADANLGESYLMVNKPDSALFYEKEAEQNALQSSFKSYLGLIELRMGDIYQALGNISMSLQYYYRCLYSSTVYNNRSSLSRACLRLSKYHLAAGNKDSALYYSLRNLEIIQSLGMVTGTETNLGVGYEYVYLSYKLNNQFDSAFNYQGLALIAKDSLYKKRIKNLADFQNLTFSEKLRLQNLEKEKTLYQNKVRTYALMTGLGMVLLIALIIYRNDRQKHKTNKVLKETLDNLKSTQVQLIQSEKMASLGELTAGIAHEIQNPLNFVNNFSEVNAELIDEIKQAVETGNSNEALHLAENIRQNLEKINFHGKRADGIVKSMLQHSRNSEQSGKLKKEPTDINTLADEYLRLAYHGLRAKDQSFNATLKTDFDTSIGLVQVIPQDIARALLNLITNAFYAVQEKQRQVVSSFRGIGTPPVLEDYQPTVSITTKKTSDKTIEIRVKDNGPGIPQNILDKIFQPFFTTKPTGQGTGLGLSLAYDIIKAHSGELRVITEVGNGSLTLPGVALAETGSEFIIQLPVV